MSEIEDKNVEFYAIWDSANTSELFKNLQIIIIEEEEEEKQQVKGILE